MLKKKLKTSLFKKENDGRSMVEMLGVLAVIGVLSIGGIFGYMYAMDYYQANNIANEVNLMRTEAKIKIGQGMAKLSLGAPYDTQQSESLSGGKGVINFNGYPVEYSCILEESPVDDCREADGYHITLSDISKGVCKTLATLLNGMKEKRFVEVNNTAFTSIESCNTETNKVAVFFDAEPTLSGFDNDVECVSDNSCGDGYCVSGVCVECKTSADCGDRICNQEEGVCVNCSSDTQCGADKYCLNNTICVQCKDNGQCDDEVCDKTTHTCRSCADDTECDGDLYCDGGVCVHCRTAQDCNPGQACVDGTCSNTCTLDNQCRENEHCENGKCTPDCTTSDNCSGIGCNTSNGWCEPCSNVNSKCNGSKKVCEENSGTCVECETSADCSGQACVNNTCQKCTNENQCSPEGLHCNTSSGTCVECLNKTQCTDSKACVNNNCQSCTKDSECEGDVCVSGKCVKCRDNSKCSGTTPICNTSKNTCEKCTADTQCAGNTICRTDGSCGTCTNDNDCDGDTNFCNKSGVCVQCAEGEVLNLTTNTCYDPVEGQPCTEFSCKLGYYCKTLDTSSCSDRLPGVCSKVKYKTGKVNNKTVYLSTDVINWWSAERFCQALPGGKTQVTLVEDLGCTTYPPQGSGNYCTHLTEDLKNLAGNSTAYSTWSGDNSFCMGTRLDSNGFVSNGGRHLLYHVMCK